MPHGDPESAPDAGNNTDALLRGLYDELRDVGRRLMRQESAGHTLQPTVLIHEVYLKLSREEDSVWTDEVHFKAVAATIMRRVLVDHARARSAAKRGGGRKTALPHLDPADEAGVSPDELLGLDDALVALRALNERQARVVELRYFGGLSFAQVAEVLDVSVNTAKNDWRFARAWLQNKLSDTGSDPT